MKKYFILALFAVTAFCSCNKNEVKDPGFFLTIDPTSVTVGVGKTATLEVTVSPKSMKDEVTWKWSTNDEKIAKVNQNGVVQGVAPGMVNVNATSGNRTATCVVTVTK